MSDSELAVSWPTIPRFVRRLFLRSCFIIYPAMRLIVQKYGGTSVATPERICNVARRIIETQRKGCRVVAVISAMAGVTDQLIKLAKAVSPKPTERELDILLATGEGAASALTAMAVNALGGTAISLTGTQAGILTDQSHQGADCEHQSKTDSRDAVGGLHRNRGWFSGSDTGRRYDHTGSRRLGLNRHCAGRGIERRRLPDFYRCRWCVHLRSARRPRREKVSEIAYDEMLEMAGSGAKVMQSRAVEFAKKFGVEFEVRSSFPRGEGQLPKKRLPAWRTYWFGESVSIGTRQNSASPACVTNREWLPEFFRISPQRTLSST